MTDPESERPQYTSMSGCLMRVVWSMAGPAIILVSTLLVIANNLGFGSWPDFVLLGGVLVSMAARFLDPGVVDSSRDDGDIGKVPPRRYALGLLAASGIALALAHLVAPLLR